MLKKYKPFFPKSSSFQNKHIFVRARKVVLIMVNVLIMFVLIMSGERRLNGDYPCKLSKQATNNYYSEKMVNFMVFELR